MVEQFERLLSDLAREFDQTPEGEVKEVLRKVIDRAAEIIYGTITIEDILKYKNNE